MGKIHENVWAKCLEIIKDNVSPQSFKTWFEPIKAVNLKGDTLTIQVPSPFFYEWLEEHYITLLKKTIKKELGPRGTLDYSIIMENSRTAANKQPTQIRVPGSNRQAARNPSISIPMEIGARGIKNPFIIPGLKKVVVDSQLNYNLTFENYVEGECNRLARSAGFAVANKPGGTSFNPLFIYGGVGLGKTHLAQAIGLEIKNNHPDKTVLYVSSEKFTQQFIESVRNNTHNDFIHFYQMIDVLLIDDVQFFAGKEKTQDVFFHIFNHLHQSGKQLVLTADRPPIEMQGIEQRLLSRFKWGLNADLQSPDLETRIAILQRKCISKVLNFLKKWLNTLRTP